MHCWAADGIKHQGKPSLMLIHGFGVDGLMGWEKQVDDFSQEFALYIPDCLFFGKSTTASSQRSELFQAECLIKLLREDKVSKVLLVGHSYGGFVAFRMGHMDPELVNKVVIVSSGICMVPSTNDPLLKEFNASHIHEVLMPSSIAIQKKSINNVLYKPRYIPDCIVRDMMEEYGHNREERIQVLDGIVIGTADAPPLPQLTQEVLIIWGSHDRVFRLDLGDQLQRHLGGRSSLIAIQSTGHVPQLEKPKEFNSHVQNFYRSKILN